MTMPSTVPTNTPDENVLDAHTATLRQIREAAGRASLGAPRAYQVAELEGPLLDLAVAKAVGITAVIHRVGNAVAPSFEYYGPHEYYGPRHLYTPSRSWDQGGPLIEEHRISLLERGDHWAADAYCGCVVEAPTPLVAAMRALVACKLGWAVIL